MNIRKFLAATALLTMVSGGAMAADGNPDAFLGGANDYNANLNGQAQMQYDGYGEYETYNEIQTRAGNDNTYIRDNYSYRSGRDMDGDLYATETYKQKSWDADDKYSTRMGGEYKSEREARAQIDWNADAFSRDYNNRDLSVTGRDRLRDSYYRSETKVTVDTDTNSSFNN